jgi:hypothetical protein
VFGDECLFLLGEGSAELLSASAMIATCHSWTILCEFMAKLPLRPRLRLGRNYPEALPPRPCEWSVHPPCLSWMLLARLAEAEPRVTSVPGWCLGRC